ncbi:hypothetical protein TRVA0_023S01200 [Trichomonascus vanleenenianus]|uniref:uncharacterized protein n=1 Tax=Trichomonascus vanleenenianus TaxID=2268995 RepID=UPI003ECAE9F3
MRGILSADSADHFVEATSKMISSRQSSTNKEGIRKKDSILSQCPCIRKIRRCKTARSVFNKVHQCLDASTNCILRLAGRDKKAKPAKQYPSWITNSTYKRTSTDKLTEKIDEAIAAIAQESNGLAEDRRDWHKMSVIYCRSSLSRPLAVVINSLPDESEQHTFGYTELFTNKNKVVQSLREAEDFILYNKDSITQLFIVICNELSEELRPSKRFLDAVWSEMPRLKELDIKYTTGVNYNIFEGAEIPPNRPYQVRLWLESKLLDDESHPCRVLRALKETNVFSNLMIFITADDFRLQGLDVFENYWNSISAFRVGSIAMESFPTIETVLEKSTKLLNFGINFLDAPEEEFIELSLPPTLKWFTLGSWNLSGSEKSRIIIHGNPQLYTAAFGEFPSNISFPQRPWLTQLTVGATFREKEVLDIPDYLRKNFTSARSVSADYSAEARLRILAITESALRNGESPILFL